MYDIDNLLAAVLEGLLLLLSRRVASDVDITLGDDDLGGVELVDDVVDLPARA